MRKINEWYIITLLILFILLISWVGGVRADGNWFGAPNAPYWMKEHQGAGVTYGAVSCGPAAADFLVSSSKYRQSIMIQNTSATVSVYICPIGTSGINAAEASKACVDGEVPNIGLRIAADSVLILDKSNRAAGSLGWYCETSSGTTELRFYAEDGF